MFDDRRCGAGGADLRFLKRANSCAALNGAALSDPGPQRGTPRLRHGQAGLSIYRLPQLFRLHGMLGDLHSG